MPVTRAATHARLQRLGTEVGQYHQATRIETLRDASTKNAVAGGYCSGICYDWIRRVLVSSTPKLTYRNLEDTLPTTGALTGEMRKQHRQDERGAMMQRQEINPILTRKNDQLYNRYTTDWDAAQRTYSRENDRINDMPGTRQEKEPLWDANLRSRNEAQALVQRAYDTGSASPTMEKAWTDFRKLMDQAIERQRRAAGKMRVGSSSPFENLDLVATQDSKEYTGTGLRNLSTEVLGNSEFGTDRCAHVGVNPPGGGTGHAIGIYRQNTSGKYHFFDPNFGVYDMTRANVIEAFEFLFGTAYPNWAGGGTSDNHPYEVGGRTKGTWSIFKGNRVSAPVVVAAPQVTVREQTVAPQRLAVVNTMPNIPVTTQTGPVVTGTPTVVPPTGGQQNPPRRRGNVLDRWTHGS
ncbi:MAG: C58 family peptidase [Acidobacteriota bacterium]|nr:C58 family peptidase [Acidobacteriota bacterium]